MTSSGTTVFNLTTSGIILESFDRVGIRPSEITREQTTSGLRSLNLELQSWNNNPLNLWKMVPTTITLVQGTSTYNLPLDCQVVTDVYVTLVQAGQDPIDRILTSVGRDEYVAYPDKNSQGAQSVFWFNRLEQPQIVLWPVPDGQSETTVTVWYMSRIQDVTTNGSQTLDITIRCLDAVCARVAARLALKYKKEDYPLLEAAAEKAYNAAYYEDLERVTVSIRPDFSVYQVH